MKAKKTVLMLLFFVGIICLVWGQDTSKTDENPFLGTWVLEEDTRITIVFTSSTYTNYYNNTSAGTKRYTYDAEKVTFSENVSTPFGVVENKWSENYSFSDDGKLILGTRNIRIFVKKQ